MKRKGFFAALAGVAAVSVPLLASAHENYVLTKDQIAGGMADWSVNAWDALKTPGNLAVAAKFGIGLLAAYGIYFLFQRSRAGDAFDRFLRRGESNANALVRIVLGISLLYSAYLNVFLGPEIPLSSFPGGGYLRIPLFVLGILMVAGFFSRIAGAGAMIVIMLATWAYRDYMLTYFNYFGEFVTLALWGSYAISIDRLRNAKAIVGEKVKRWEATILRVTYGVSVLYPAVSIKLLHPIIMVEIAKQYHLTGIRWLFPADPLLIALGTGLTQVVVGLAIVVGFETRLNSLITFTLYVMSILYFKEAVWPHYILLALAGYLFVNDGGDWTLDAWLKKFKKRWPRSKTPRPA